MAELRVPDWVGDPEEDLAVMFTHRALADLAALQVERLTWLRGPQELQAALRHGDFTILLPAHVMFLFSFFLVYQKTTFFFFSRISTYFCS